MSNDALRALTAKPFAPSAPPPPRTLEEVPEPPPSCPPVTIFEPTPAPPAQKKERDRMAWLVGLGFLAALGLGALVMFPHHQQPVPPSKVALAGASLKAPPARLVLVSPATETVPAATTPVVIVPPPVVKNGAVQTFAAASGKPVYVDGTQVGVGGTRIETACGKHSVSVGTGKPKLVVIPCTVWTPVTVGSPDGT